MNNIQPDRTVSPAAGSFDSLFSHDETDHRPTAERSDEQGRPFRKSDDEAAPGRPLEMKFSGDGEPTERRAAS